MRQPHLNQACAMIETFEDTAPAGQELTAYDKAHIKLYARLLDADADGADWTEAVHILFGLDPEDDPERCRRIHDSHLARARWMTHTGYRHLLRQSHG
jgi:hypothetical protein